MNNKNVLQRLILILILLLLTGCNRREKSLTVSEVGESADSLEGKRIRVRGQTAVRFIPVHPMQIGGCPVDGPGEDEHFVAKLSLLDENSPGSKHRLFIAESSLNVVNAHSGANPF